MADIANLKARIGADDADATLAEALEAALDGMHWLTPADTGAVALARAYAKRIDDAIQYAEGQEVTKALYLGPHLLNALRTLGGTPDARGAVGNAGAPANPAGEKLTQFKARAAGRKVS